MTLWQTSLTYQIWVWLCDVYEDSTLHRFLVAAGRWGRCFAPGTRRGT